jgi:hypothetical protein
MDLLALIAADPTLLPLWAVLVFAAGMYPVGMLFSCTPCCGCVCEEGTLPETLTVTFNGYSDKTQGPDLIKLGFQSCFGSGATARVTAPGGAPETDKGPISAVSLTEGGSGYAKLGRVAPTLTASGVNGTSGTFEVTLANAKDSCNVDYWKVSQVTATGVTGYVDGEQITITAAEGDTVAEGAVVTLVEGRDPPTLSASVSGGTGASLTVNLSENTGTPKTWRVSSVTVGSGGSGYTNGASVTFTAAAGDSTTSSASATIKTGRVAPTVSTDQDFWVSGTGAEITASLAEDTDSNGRKVWRVQSFAVVSGGTGYSLYDGFPVTVTDGTELANAYGEVSSVDSSGAILAVDVWNQGEFYKDSGEIESVAVSSGGQYFRIASEPDAVVQAGGVYYREDASVPPYVSPVTVTISQQAPSTGTGAELTATVDDDPESPTFGKITSVTITSGGSGYLAWKWVSTECCGHYMNGKSFVLRRSGPGGSQFAVIGGVQVPRECTYYHVMCGGWEKSASGITGPTYWEINKNFRDQVIRVGYRGPLLPPVADVSRSELTGATLIADFPYLDTKCAASFTTDALISDCDDFEFTGTTEDGKTISVVAGGVYDPLNKNPTGDSNTTCSLSPFHGFYLLPCACSVCCQGAEAIPPEISISVTDSRPNPSLNLSGTHILSDRPTGVGVPSSWGNQDWRIYIPMPEGYPPASGAGSVFTPTFRVWISESDCSTTDSGGECDNCVKKCSVMASIAIPETFAGTILSPSPPYTPQTIFRQYSASDSRFCGDDGGQENLDKRCLKACVDTPLCGPPAGRSFTFKKDIPGATGYGCGDTVLSMTIQ